MHLCWIFNKCTRLLSSPLEAHQSNHAPKPWKWRFQSTQLLPHISTELAFQSFRTTHIDLCFWHGFWAFNNTSTNIFSVVYIAHNMNRRKNTTTVLSDVGKTFDQMRRDGLINKLSVQQVLPCQSWRQSFFSERHQTKRSQMLLPRSSPFFYIHQWHA